MSVPGVGPITALAFRATTDRPDRFRRSRDIGAHLGLTPARYQPGETDIQGRVSGCGDELAHGALRGSAYADVRSREWSSLRAWGIKIAKHRGMARARVAVARKLAVILHRMWTDGASSASASSLARSLSSPELSEKESRRQSFRSIGRSGSFPCGRWARRSRRESRTCGRKPAKS
jgi:hypothetical protein